MRYIDRPVVVRGGGDLATGTILRLGRAGYPVIVLECACPTAIRREAAFSEAVRLGEKTVEGMTARLAAGAEEAMRAVRPGRPAVLVDEKAESLKQIRPEILVDAILAKRNLGTSIDMAALTIALGPGFTAGRDVRYVIETMRGHNLGRIYSSGSAVPNTGVPGIVGGFGADRVIHAPCGGVLRGVLRIGEMAEKGRPVAFIAGDGTETAVPASITGVLRGILPDGFPVTAGMKMADIDPRPGERENCFTVSDKSRCIAGSVLELVCAYERNNLP